MSEHRRYGNNDEATFRSRISHFVRQSIARSSSAGCWLAKSHGFATVSPRRRGSQCSRNILGLLQLGSSFRNVCGESYGHHFWGPGLHPACGFLEPGHTVDCDRYTQLLRKLKSDIRDKRPDIDMNITIHHDNARIHPS